MAITIFISHASEDKQTVALPLAELLRKRGVKVWLDVWNLKLGDGLHESIEKGLHQADYGVVILSPVFFKKTWTKRELDGLFNKELLGKKVVLPVRHGLEQADLGHLPILADRINCSTDEGLESVVLRILDAVGVKDLELGESRELVYKDSRMLSVSDAIKLFQEGDTSLRAYRELVNQLIDQDTTTQISNDSYLDALTLTDVMFKRVKTDVRILSRPGFTMSLGALKNTFVQAIERLSKSGGSVRILTTDSDMPHWLDQLCDQYRGTLAVHKTPAIGETSFFIVCDSKMIRVEENKPVSLESEEPFVPARVSFNESASAKRLDKLFDALWSQSATEYKPPKI